MSDFNLRKLVREVTGSTTLTDPGDIAREVGRRIDEDSVRAALDEALRVFVRQIISEDRPHGFTTPAPRPGRSAKVAGIRDGWQRKLRARYATEHEWKFLADCTHEDLIFIATDLDRKAAQNQAKARSFRGLAALLTDHGVERVRDLPPAAQMTALGDAA